MSKIDGIEILKKLTDISVDSILGMTDEKIIAEAKEQFGDDYKNKIEQTRNLIKNAIEKYEQTKTTAS